MANNQNTRKAEPLPMEDDAVIAAGKRNASVRTMFAWMVYFTILGVPMTGLMLIFSKWSWWLFTPSWGATIGLSLGLIINGVFLPYYTLAVENYQGMVARDLLMRKLVIFGPGFHARFFWDSVHRESHQSLKDVTFNLEATWPSQNGQMVAKHQFQWQPCLTKLDVFFGITENAIKKSIGGIFNSFYSTQVGRLDRKDAKAAARVLPYLAQKIFDLNTDVSETASFSKEERRILELIAGSADPDEMAKTSNTLKAKEDNFGIVMKGSLITDMDYDKKIQEKMDDEAGAESERNAAMKLGGYDPKKEEDIKRFAEDPNRQGLLDRAGALSGTGTKINRNVDDRTYSFDPNVVNVLKEFLGKVKFSVNSDDN